MKKTPPIVEVHWHDHWGASPGWRLLGDLDCSPLTCSTVGYLVKEDKTGLLLMAGLDNQNGEHTAGAGQSYVLKSAIIKRKVIRK